MSNILKQQFLNSGIVDKLKLNKKKYENITESKSIVAVYDQQLFVWHDVISCLLTVKIRFDQEQQRTHQTLVLTNPPVFEVETLSFNNTGSLLAVSGRNGVMIVEIPWRCGKFSRSGDETQNIMARSWNVAEQFFICSSRVHVVQISWHPESSSSTHLTILSTDNYIRTYDVTDPQVPQQVISLGLDSKSSYLSSDTKISFSSCLGENAVSFDFGPPETVSLPKCDRRDQKDDESDTERLVWPIFLLHGNGDVYVVKAPMKKERYHPPVRAEGPLVMYPPDEDNYGFDSCSILCLHSSPPSLVIATSTNMLYHCIILENPNLSSINEAKVSSSWSYNSMCEECDISLYVYESVELPLSSGEDQTVDCRPIRLYKDATSCCKYHFTHLTGVHSVALPFLQSIEASINKEDAESWLSLHEEEHCVVEHLLCTKPFQKLSAVPVLGLDIAVSDASAVLICLVASWEFLCLPLVSSYHSVAPDLLFKSDVPNTPTHQDRKTALGESFMESMHQQSRSSPYLKSSAASNMANVSPQQWMDLLSNANQHFRTDYIQRLNTLYANLESRAKVLTQLKEQQLKEIKYRQEEKASLQVGAERLAEKYEDIRINQQTITKRLEQILQRLQKHLPDLSEAELEMKRNLSSYEENLNTFQSSLDEVKKKLKFQKEKMREIRNKNALQSATNKLGQMTLGETQLKHVKELLGKEAESVAHLVKDVNALKKENGL